MPRHCPHPLALFSLRPLPECDRAKDVVAHPSNSHLVSISPRDGELVLDIGFHVRSNSCDTLATLGRNNTDIILEGSSIGRIQCSFEIDLDTGIVMLYDRSNGQTTQVSGENATPFEWNRPRRVVVQNKLNTTIGMGGVRCDLVQFKLEWHQDPTQVVKKIKNQRPLPYGREENPRLARTADEAPTELPTPRETRLHTPGQRQLKIRYAKVHPLGSGQFGVVHKAIDVDSGKFMAVKIIERPVDASKKEHEEWRKSVHYALKREVENLSKISHPHIVDYIASQGWEELQPEIFMGLKEGSLESLIESGGVVPESVANTVFFHILQAIDCLANKGIIHRDVKPANILYVSQPDGQYQFQLGDFGICNHAVSAATYAGSPIYIAPEMYQKGNQTSKLDVWSLFVTMLWTLDVREFRRDCNQFKSVKDVREAILTASKIETVSKLQEMAIADPEKRASAAQMLVKLYNGDGLSTPRNQILALTSSPPVIAASRDSTPVPPTLIPRTAQKKPRLPKNGNIFVAQYRVDKSYGPYQAQPARWLQQLRGKPLAKS